MYGRLASLSAYIQIEAWGQLSDLVKHGHLRRTVWVLAKGNGQFLWIRYSAGIKFPGVTYTTTSCEEAGFPEWDDDH